MLNYFVQALQQQAEEYLMISDKPQLIPCMPCLAPRPGDPSLLLGGFSKIMHVAADCILAQRESVDEDASNFAIVNMETSEVRQKGSNRLNLYLQFFFFFCVLPVPRRKCVCDRFQFPTV
jgi:hypothetical protein